MRTRSLLAWIAAGLAGLALAAGVSYAATQLSSQRIGLAAEPPSAGEELAPPAATGPARTTTRPVRTTGGAREDHGERRDDPAEEREEREHGGDWDD